MILKNIYISRFHRTGFGSLKVFVYKFKRSTFLITHYMYIICQSQKRPNILTGIARLCDLNIQCQPGILMSSRMKEEDRVIPYIESTSGSSCDMCPKTCKNSTCGRGRIIFIFFLFSFLYTCIFLLVSSTMVAQMILTPV